MGKRVVAFTYLYKEKTLYVVLVTTKSGNVAICRCNHNSGKITDIITGGCQVKGKINYF